MSSSNSNVKALCEEYFTSNFSEEQTLRILNKILSILKVSEKFQKDVFIQLSDKGLNKLLSSLKDNNLEVRKMSCKVITELLNNNEVLQNIFCEKFNFNPIGNIICLNWLPKYLKENIKIDEKLITEIKNSPYSYGKPLKYWMWPENFKYSDENVPDPQKYLIGFYYANKNSLFMNNTEEKLDERIDIKLLTFKLENENYEDDKLNYVAAGSGSESSVKINESIKDKYMVTESLINNDSSKKTTVPAKQTAAVEVNSLLDRIKLTNIINNDKKNENKKLRDDYKKIIKEKNYSKSIDTNIPKNKHSGPGVISSSNQVAHNIQSTIGHSSITVNSIIANMNNDLNSNRIKINKAVKK